MTTTATLHGRDLVLAVEGIDDPFIIKPLPGVKGKELTHLFLAIATRQETPVPMETVLKWAVNGAERNDADEWEWIDDGPNSRRIEDELALHEAEDVFMPAFYWQTVLGIDGVNAFLRAGGGMTGSVKALGFLASTLGISPFTTSPSSELETRIRKLVNIPSTGTPNGSATLDRLPDAKRSRKPKQKNAGRSPASSSGA